jgi:TfoX/Sxy family transcriptional regulator of competence genes
MTGSRALADHVLDLLGPRSDVGLAPFFGGWSLRHRGRQVGIVMDTVYAKVDLAHRDTWHDNGSVPFRYTARGRTVTVEAYWSVPAGALDDPDLLRDLFCGTDHDSPPVPDRPPGVTTARPS